MRHTITTLVGKSVRQVARLRGDGSALPGLVVEHIDPQFVARTLAKLSRGVVLITGTNGKTTTTKMVTALLESQGLRVFTNPTGSNFTRGVAAAIVGAANRRGIIDADIAVLELDEAYAVHFVRAVQPSYCLLLNVMRDQLDRFGEIDKTADLLHIVAERTTRGIIINRDDPRLGASSFRDSLVAPIVTYGVAPKLAALFPSDDNLRGSSLSATQPTTVNDVCLESLYDHTATIRYGTSFHEITLQLDGIYNVQNAVGAIATTRVVVGDALDEHAMLAALSRVTPAFGRGETIAVDGIDYQLILVKNPAGFRLGIKSFESSGHEIMIAINDNYADGRDMSWLWDVDFEELQSIAVVTGIRAYDMALRLQYDNVAVGRIEPSITQAFTVLRALPGGKPRRIYCTYTAMLALRKELAKYAAVGRIS